MNLDEILAYCCIGIAVVIFGTNFIPVKKIATGDGLFFQALVCHGNIFHMVILPHFCRGSTHFTGYYRIGIHVVGKVSWKKREVGRF